MGKHNGKRYHFLYKTTNLVNEKFYIGVHSTYNLQDGYLGSGKKLKRAIEKYDKHNFQCEILEFFESREELLQREKEIVNEKLLQDPQCMNLQFGGGGGFSSKEHQLKCSIAGSSKGAKGFWKKFEDDVDFQSNMKSYFSERMKKYHEEGIIKKTFQGKTHSDDSKKKMSEKAKLRTGEKNSQFGTCWINDGKKDLKIKKEKLNECLKNGYVKGRMRL